MIYGIRTLKLSDEVTVSTRVSITQKGAFWQDVHIILGGLPQKELERLREQFDNTQCRGLTYPQAQVDEWDIELSDQWSTDPWVNFIAKVLWVVDNNVIKKDDYIQTLKDKNKPAYDYFHENVSLPVLICLSEEQTIKLISALWERFKIIQQVKEAYKSPSHITIRGYSVAILDHGFDRGIEREALRGIGAPHIFLHQNGDGNQWYLSLNKTKTNCPISNGRLNDGVTFSKKADLSDCIKQISNLLK